MDFKDIKQLASLMKDMGLTALEYAEGGASIRMERGTASAAALAAANAVANTAPAAVPVQPAGGVPVEAAAVPAASEASDAYTVTSPMVGVFYAAPGTDKKPYVSIGDRVKAGDVLCIVEAMKMMNEITTDKSGVITEICVGNKQIVEYGHPLFRLRVE
jgi:acetyl-CoA carboxylase biotin carboxyl carrier protein